MDEVLESLTRQACRIMRVERAVVVVRDESDPRLAVVVAGHGVPPDYIGRRIGIDEGMAGRVITTGEPVLVDDYAKFPRRIAHAAGEGLRAGAAVPIRRDGVVHGRAGGRHHASRAPLRRARSWRRCCGLPSWAPWRSSRRRCARSSSGPSRPGVEAMAAAVDMRDDYTRHALRGGRAARARRSASAWAWRRSSSASSSSRRGCTTSARSACPTPCCASRGRWTSAEWEIMRQHPTWGADMLCRVPGLKRVSRIVRHAHERWDGDGYPDRLSREDIPLASRIILACDAYNAMTSDRPYRDALRPWIAVSELREGAGGQFDPDVVDALVERAARASTAIDLRLFQQASRRRQTGLRFRQRFAGAALARRRQRATRAASCLLRAGAMRTPSPRRLKRLPWASCTARVGPGRGADDCAFGRRMCGGRPRPAPDRHHDVAGVLARQVEVGDVAQGDALAPRGPGPARMTRRPPRSTASTVARPAPGREQHVDRVAAAAPARRSPSASRSQPREKRWVVSTDDLARLGAALRDERLERAPRRAAAGTAVRGRTRPRGEDSSASGGRSGRHGLGRCEVAISFAALSRTSTPKLAQGRPPTFDDDPLVAVVEPAQLHAAVGEARAG